MEIVATVKRTSKDGKTFDGGNTRLEEIGSKLSHTIMTTVGTIYRENTQVVIEIRKVDSMYEADKIVEQSRAEQSRAEQSRAEQSRAA